MSFSERLFQAAAAQQRAAREPRPLLRTYAGRATRNDFLAWIYESALVRADEFTAHTADKLFFAKLLDTYAPEAYAAFHPRTFSVAELGASPSAFLKDMQVIAKPVAGMNGEGGRIYPSTYEFLAYLSQDPSLFGAGGPSALTNLLSSGERYLVQEKVGGRGPELRLHTMEGRVVKGATFTRWDEHWDAALFAEAERAMQDFLDLLPAWFVDRQAWSADLLRGQDGFKLIEVNTNRGKPAQWSGDLSLPDVLSAYARHLESYYGADFSQAGGPELLAGQGNLEKFVKKFGAEAWERHQSLRSRSFLGPE